MKLKRFLTAALSLLMLGSAAAFPAHADDPPSALLSLPEVLSYPGEVAAFPVTLTDLDMVEQADHVAFVLTYDAPLMPVPEAFGTETPYVEAGTLDTDNCEFRANTAEHLLWFQSPPEGIELKEGVLFTLYFLLPEDIEDGSYRVNFKEAYLYNESITEMRGLTTQSGVFNTSYIFSTGTPMIRGAKTAAQPGETVDYEIELPNNPGHFGAGVKLHYDKALVPLEKRTDDAFIKTGDAAGTDSVLSGINAARGLIEADSVPDGGECTADGILYTVGFQVPADAAPGYYPIILAGEYLDQEKKPQKFLPVHGWIQVKIPEIPVKLRAERIAAAPGDTVCYSVYTDRNAGYDYVLCNLSFDPSLTVRKESGVAAGAYTVSGPAALTSSNIASFSQEKGTLSFVDTGNPKTATGKLFSVYFTVPEDAATGAYPIKFTDYDAKLDGKHLSLSAEDGQITVVAAKKGDVNCDGNVSSADAVLMQRWLRCDANVSLPYWKNGDMNDDNLLNAADLTAVKRLLLNQ